MERVTTNGKRMVNQDERKKSNKIYWFEGVTEKGTKALLNDDNPKFKWLRFQRNRRILVAFVAVGIVLVAMGSYWSILKTSMNVAGDAEVIVFSVTAIFVILALVGGYSLLRVSVRSVADAPDELLDERQVQVRNTSFRYAYYLMGYIVMALMLLMLFGPEVQMFQPEGNDGSYLVIATLFAFSSMPSMVLAWREKDI
jgi:hypothetical protein